MKISITSFFVFLSLSSIAQTKTYKNDSCSCVIEIKWKTPDHSDEDSVASQVIIEIDIDSNCRFSNPVIFKSASNGRNSVALDYARQVINQNNQCNRKCRFKKCTPRKKLLPVKFEVETEE